MHHLYRSEIANTTQYFTGVKIKIDKRGDHHIYCYFLINLPLFFSSLVASRPTVELFLTEPKKSKTTPGLILTNRLEFPKSNAT